MKLGAFIPKHGTRVSLRNRKGPSIETLTKAELERLAEVQGEIVAGQWRACIDGWAFVVAVERSESHV